MIAKFCKQCGSEIVAGNSFCKNCGAKQDIHNINQAQRDQPIREAYEPPKTYQPSQTYQQPQVYQPTGTQPPGQVYQSQYRAHNPQFTSARATGLIFGVFSLIIVFMLTLILFILPSEKDLSIMGQGTEEQFSGPEAPSSIPGAEPYIDSSDTSPMAKEEYGEIPESILSKINKDALEEDYYGEYVGTATFRNENLDHMAMITGDSSVGEILSTYNGKTFDCTGQFDGRLRAFSPHVYSERGDGSFYDESCYPKEGIYISEEDGYDEDMGINFYAADKAYLLDDGGIYAIAVMTAKFDDGNFLATEVRIELKPAP